MKDGRVQHNGTLAEIKRADPELYSAWNSAITQSQGDAHGTDTRSVISGASDDETASALTDITTKVGITFFQRTKDNGQVWVTIINYIHLAFSTNITS